MLLTHALAFSASQFVLKKKSPRIYTSIHSGGFELTKLNYTRLEDNLIRHRGDRVTLEQPKRYPVGATSPSKTGFVDSAHRLTDITLLKIWYKVIPRGVADLYPGHAPSNTRDRSMYHKQLQI